jgi:hypothetical protein
MVPSATLGDIKGIMHTLEKQRRAVPARAGPPPAASREA